MNLFILIPGTVLIMVFSWFISIRQKRYHGIARFFSFESIFILVLLNCKIWFREPFSLLQIISWTLLIFSIYFAVAGFLLLKKIGKPDADFENTSVLVKEGLYKYIRHPLYLSLLLVGTGAMMKDPGLLQLVFGTVNLVAIWLTAGIEEKEMIAKFGNDYIDYMKETRMFIPYLKTMQKLICSVYMKRLLFIIFLISQHQLLLPQDSSSSGNSDFEYYKQINGKELRLPEYKDNDEALRIKLIQLDVINRSRKKFRAAPVKLDILASRVANKMCREAAENKYVSHWNLAGEKPYHRYALAGGYDHVSENAYGEWTSGTYEISNSLIGKMMETGHGTFMAERAPNDGHKKNIIDKAHNFIGIGFFVKDDQFRYYEEFIDRYLEFEKIPSELKINEQSGITVKPIGAGYLYFLIAYREKFPQPQKVSQLSRTGSYNDYSNEEYLKIPAWELARYRNGSTYRIPLKFTKEGLYYIHIFLDKKDNTASTVLNTKGKTVGSSIVIRVSR